MTDAHRSRHRSILFMGLEIGAVGNNAGRGSASTEIRPYRDGMRFMAGAPSSALNMMALG
jgi:hypothetical protein